MHIPRLLAALLSGPVFLASLQAQGDFDLDKATAGTLGGTLTLQIDNGQSTLSTAC